jgi:lytic murein transglycosylase
MLRGWRLHFVVALLMIVAASGRAVAQGKTLSPDPTFQAFLDELWADAQARGITRTVFDRAFDGLTPDPRVMPITRRQPEYGKPFGDYLATMVSAARIATGTRKAKELERELAAIEERYGVPSAILLAIWGIETAYGAYKDRWDVIRSLATLAHARFRHPYFRDELLVALTMIQDGHIARGEIMGSWAGAMGQPQFMPSNFLAYAVDFDGDGRRNIWTSVPDVLASTANYLHKAGWERGLPWGFEVTVPPGFDLRRSRASFPEWQQLGLRRADGNALPAEGAAILFFPSGASGPAFLVTANFEVIKRYNNSDAYAVAVAHLADRIQGLKPIRAAWPASDRQLNREERIALQRALAALGYKVRNFTGHLDFDLRDAVREMQVKFGMSADGHPSLALLDRLAREPRR